jgi:hypothetical protein
MAASTPDLPSAATGRRGSPAPAGAADAFSTALLAAALLIGLLRFWRLGEWSLWIDEAYTYADAWFGQRGEGVWNPLGYRIIRATAGALAERPDELDLRLGPAIAGWLCIPMAWFTFRPVIGPRRAALVALLLAVHPWHLYWSQNARFYTFAQLTSLGGGGLAVRGILRGRTSLYLVGLLGLAAAGAFHVTAAALAPAFIVAFSLARGREPGDAPGRRNELAGWGVLLVCVLASAPWWGSALFHHLGQKGTGSLLAGPVHMALTSGYFFTPMVGAGAVLGMIHALRSGDIGGRLAAAVVVVTLLGLTLISTRMLMTAQYAFALLPWALALAVVPMESLGRRIGGRTLVLGAAFLLAGPLLASSLLYFTTRHGERPRWREAFALVDRRAEPGDLVLCMGAPVAEYYLGDEVPDPRRPRRVKALADWFPDGPRRWNRHDRRAWIVTRPQWLPSFFNGDDRAIAAWLESDCHLVESFPVAMEGKDLEVRVYLFEGAGG